MKFKIISDLHTEFFNHNGSKHKFKRIIEHFFPVCEHDKECILLCAGDMGTYKYYKSTYEMMFSYFSKRFQSVVIVPGNHSWYNSTGVWGREAEFWKDKQVAKNIVYLDNDYKQFEDVMLIGSCLWTSCNTRDPISMYHVKKGLNDYRLINKAQGTCAPIQISPEDTIDRHESSVYFIKQALSHAREQKLTPVIISHHAPSEKSVHPRFKGDLLNHAFFSNLDWLMEHHEIPLWVHGHTHNSFDYTNFGTRVVCNPFGYIGTMDQNKEFNKDLVVEV